MTLTEIKEPKQKRSQATRRNIMETAVRLFEMHGFEKVHSNWIAREAGLSVGAFYRHFPNKMALLIEMVRTRLMENTDLFKGLIPRSLPSKKAYFSLWEMIIDRSFTLYSAYPGLAKIANRLRYDHPEILELFNRAKNERLALLEALVKLGMTRSWVRKGDGTAMTESLYTWIESSIVRWVLYEDTNGSLDKLKKELVTMVRCYLTDPTGA